VEAPVLEPPHGTLLSPEFPELICLRGVCWRALSRWLCVKVRKKNPLPIKLSMITLSREI